jgi:hypothetical protein
MYKHNISPFGVKNLGSDLKLKCDDTFDVSSTPERNFAETSPTRGSIYDSVLFKGYSNDDIYRNQQIEEMNSNSINNEKFDKLESLHFWIMSITMHINMYKNVLETHEKYYPIVSDIFERWNNIKGKFYTKGQCETTELDNIYEDILDLLFDTNAMEYKLQNNCKNNKAKQRIVIYPSFVAITMDELDCLKNLLENYSEFLQYKFIWWKRHCCKSIQLLFHMTDPCLKSECNKLNYFAELIQKFDENNFSRKRKELRPIMENLKNFLLENDKKLSMYSPIIPNLYVYHFVEKIRQFLSIFDDIN